MTAAARHLTAFLVLALIPFPALSDAAKVEGVTARVSASTWTFDVTLTHGDTGWDDYADGWRVVLEDGTVLGTRKLLHPHVTEQPFTRSLSGVSIPEGVKSAFIEARTSVEGWDSHRFEVEID